MSVGHNSIFEIGFWHPFGPHAGESPEKILKRKRKEITDNRWTLWSFQHRTEQTLDSWYREIQLRKPAQVFVFCSAGKGSKDTKSKPKYCNYYIPVNSIKQKKVPSKMKVPHPMKGKMNKGAAFIVKRIIYPDTNKSIPIEWYKKGKWEARELPTRPEYLIRRGKGAQMPAYSVILELRYPYLAVVGR